MIQCLSVSMTHNFSLILWFHVYTSTSHTSALNLKQTSVQRLWNNTGIVTYLLLWQCTSSLCKQTFLMTTAVNHIKFPSIMACYLVPHVHMCAHARMCVRAHARTCMCVCMCVCVHVCMFACVCVCVCVCCCLHFYSNQRGTTPS